MMVGRDVQLGWVLSLSARALVGKVCYSEINRTKIRAWVVEYWKPLLTYCPKVHILVNKWVVFHFLNDDHATLILGRTWVFGRGSLVLNDGTQTLTHLRLWLNKYTCGFS